MAKKGKKRQTIKRKNQKQTQSKNEKRYSTLDKEDDDFTNNPLNHLKENYENPDSYISFLSAGSLYRVYRGRLSRKVIDNFLAQTESYTLTKNEKQRRIFNRTLSWHVGDKIQCDLIHIEKLSDFNAGYKYILCVIDCYSKFLHTELLRDKTCESTVRAMENILQRFKTIPYVMSSDNGGEFNCVKMRELMKAYDIKQFFTLGDFKAAVVERVQLTLQQRIYRYMIAKETYCYYDVLRHITHNYNRTYHKSIRMSPIKAIDPENADKLSEAHSYNIVNMRVKRLKPKFAVDDIVRVSFKKNKFSRGYGQTYTDTRYIIQDVNVERLVPVYKLKTHRDKPVRGAFYESQLQRVDIPTYRGNITATRKKRGKIQHKITFKGYDEEDDEWIDSGNIDDIK